MAFSSLWSVRPCRRAPRDSVSREKAAVAAAQVQRRATLLARGKASHSLRGEAFLLPQFLASPAGHNACLQLDGWPWLRLSPDTYVCQAPSVSLLGYDVSPSLTLSVEVLESAAVVRLLRTQLDGSESIQAQSKRLSATGTHTIAWCSQRRQLASSVDLSVSLDLFTGPFALLPERAVTLPGNLLLSRIVSRSLRSFLPGLEAAYNTWLETEIQE